MDPDFESTSADRDSGEPRIERAHALVPFAPFDADAPAAPASGAGREAEPGEATPAIGSALLALVSEAVKRPLGLLHATAEQLLGDAPPPPHEVGAAMDARVREIAALIQDALDLDRLERGALTFEPAEFDLALLVGQLPARLDRACGGAWTLEAALAPDVPTLLTGDPGRWLDVMDMAIAEAVTIADRGTVRVEVTRTAETGRRVELALALSVTAADDEDPREIERLERAFESAAGGPPRTARALRVELARRLVALAGGTLRVSRRDPRGLEIRLTAPFGVRPAPHVRADEPDPASLRGRRVLLVTTEGPSAERHVAMLTLWGCRAEHVASGQIALDDLRAAHAARDPFHFVIVDSDTEDLEGIVFGRLVRLQSDLADAQLVLFAGLGVRGDSAAAREIGFDAYLPRSIRSTELRAAMIELLRRARAGVRRQTILTRHELAEMQHERHRILLVGLGGVDGLVARSLLGRRGFGVEVVDDGARAVELAETTTFDLVVCAVEPDDPTSLSRAQALRVVLEERGETPFMALVGPGAAARAALERAGIAMIHERPAELARWCVEVETIVRGDSEVTAGPSASVRSVAVVSGLDDADEFPVLSIRRLEETSLGMPALEIELLDTLIDDGPARFASMAEAIVGAVGANASERVVGLRELAMNVGAYELGRVCAALEGILADGREGEAHAMLHRVGEALERALEACRGRRAESFHRATAA